MWGLWKRAERAKGIQAPWRCPFRVDGRGALLSVEFACFSFLGPIVMTTTRQMSVRWSPILLDTAVRACYGFQAFIFLWWVFWSCSDDLERAWASLE